MKRGLATALALAILAPVAAVVVIACSASPCCLAGSDASVAAPMECCPPTMCANPSPGRQPKADAAAQTIAVVAPAEAVHDELPSRIEHSSRPAQSPPPPTRVRLALIATLLI